MSALAFDGVTCVRGGRTLFEGLSFALGPGDALIVTGSNGVGKSSLLRLVAGLLEPASGTIACEGRIALADERTALDPSLPLVRALSFWAEIDGGNAREALDAVGLAPLADVPVRMLSAGQKRRATLARVIASRAQTWLLDEPANGLDGEAVTRLEAIVAAHRAGGGLVVAASHQQLAFEGAQSVVLAP